MGTPAAASSPPPLHNWEKNLLGISASQATHLLPGVIFAAGLAWISVRLSDLIGVNVLGFEKSPVSPVIVAILLGLALGNVTRLPAQLDLGLDFSVKKLLRLGIILLGIRLSIFDAFKLGAMGVPIVMLCIASALLLTTYLNNRLNLPERLGALVAIGTSICGVTAIVAAAPAIDADDEEVSYAVAVITVFGIVATFAYPYLAYQIFDGNAVQAGLFLGTSVHETAQVAGAGMVFADAFNLPIGLDTATITKMVRNVFMAFVIPLVAIYYNRRNSDNNAEKTSVAKLIPLFILGFLFMAAVRSIGDSGINGGGNAFGLWSAGQWSTLTGGIKHWASNFMVIALVGVGLKTRFSIIKGLGIRPFLVGLIAALTVGAVSIAAISLLDTFVAF